MVVAKNLDGDALEETMMEFNKNPTTSHIAFLVPGESRDMHKKRLKLVECLQHILDLPKGSAMTGLMIRWESKFQHFVTMISS